MLTFLYNQLSMSESEDKIDVLYCRSISLLFRAHMPLGTCHPAEQTTVHGIIHADSAPSIRCLASCLQLE